MLLHQVTLMTTCKRNILMRFLMFWWSWVFSTPRTIFSSVGTLISVLVAEWTSGTVKFMAILVRSFYNSDSEQLTREKDDSCSCDGHRAVYNLSKFLLLSIRGFLSVSLFWWLELSNFQSESQIASIYLCERLYWVSPWVKCVVNKWKFIKSSLCFSSYWFLIPLWFHILLPVHLAKKKKTTKPKQKTQTTIGKIFQISDVRSQPEYNHAVMKNSFQNPFVYIIK